MPELSKDLMTLLNYLLPGFLVAWLFYALTGHQKPVQFERVIQALIFTLLVSGLVVVERELLILAGKVASLGTWNSDAALLCSIVTAIALGLLFAYCTNTDRPHEWLRSMGISKRSSHTCEWHIVFAFPPTFVVLEMKDGRRLYGWPSVWPSSPDKGHIYITEASWIHEDPPVPLPGTDGVLVPVADVAHVEFSKRVEVAP